METENPVSVCSKLDPVPSTHAWITLNHDLGSHDMQNGILNPDVCTLARKNGSVLLGKLIAIVSTPLESVDQVKCAQCFGNPQIPRQCLIDSSDEPYRILAWAYCLPLNMTAPGILTNSSVAPSGELVYLIITSVHKTPHSCKLHEQIGC